MENIQTHIDALESALATGAAVFSVTVDGMRIQYDRHQALEELKYWQRRAAIQRGDRRVMRAMRLGGVA